MNEKVMVRIDGELIAATAGQSVLQVARENGKDIPALCSMDGLSAQGSCRLCMVEIQGGRKLQPACTTPVSEGLAVTTHTAQLAGYRKMVLELLFAERNHICAVCVSSGHCELQSLAQEHGITNVRFDYSFPNYTPDTSHPRFVFDPDRCVLCARCVRTCAEIEGAHVWDIAGRGVASGPVTEMQRPWGEAMSCTSCGKCVQACPTGALAEKGWAVEEMTKHKGVVRTLETMREGQ